MFSPNTPIQKKTRKAGVLQFSRAGFLFSIFSLVSFFLILLCTQICFHCLLFKTHVDKLLQYRSCGIFSLIKLFLFFFLVNSQILTGLFFGGVEGEEGV